MKDINKILPRPKNMLWGCLTNFKPTNIQLEQMDNYLPYDNKWHTIFNGPGNKSTVIDGKEVRRKSIESLT